jgi:hypothetical protein
VNNIAVLRRVSLIAMLVAVVSGTVSLFFLFTAPSSDKTLFIVSVVALAVGMLLDRRAGKLEDRDAR